MYLQFLKKTLLFVYFLAFYIFFCDNMYDKGDVDMQYALGGLSNNIFASKYVTYMPDKEQLIVQVEFVLASNDNID